MIHKLKRTPKPKGKTIEQLIEAFCNTTNPVTRSVYRDIIKNRLENASKTGELQ